MKQLLSVCVLVALFTTTLFGQPTYVREMSCTAAGASSTAYTCSITGMVEVAYVTRKHYTFCADVANTAAATISFNSIGAKTIKKNHDQDLVANDIEAGQCVDLVYDGTYMQMQSTLGNAASGGGNKYDQSFFTYGCYSTGTCAVSGGWYTALSGGTVAGLPFSGLVFPSDTTDRSAILGWVMPASVTSLTITVYGGADGFGDGSISAPIGVSYSCVTAGSTDVTALSFTSIGTATVAATGGYKTLSNASVTWSSGLCTARQLTYFKFLMNFTEGDKFVLTSVSINAN